MQIPRYVVGAFLFSLIWASIAYTQGHITDFRILLIGIVFFVIVGSLISWGLACLLRWYKDRQ